MAKKTVKKKRLQESDNDIWGSLSVFFTNERLRFLVGLLLCFAVIYVSIAMASFFCPGASPVVVTAVIVPFKVYESPYLYVPLVSASGV